ncbi:unnamed protein product [Blepharisma stoltei]|uniref:Uncharacterized protein n=1 Tax=Blepharisma stoltei TaxID=1481888 RepID=A0AAU9INN9_9CILI|nr:unnamed protein product [Blepharisma stoltei]
MKSLISFIALIGLATCVSIGVKDSTLDPGRIMWPKETWVNSPIQISQTNAGSAVTITFNFRTSTALTNGVLEVDLPSGLTGGPLYIPGSFGQNQDKTLSHSTTITLPSSAGVYGPFALITRSSQNGQIYDANYVFGCIATTSSVSASTTLSVTNAATSPVVGSADVLSFAFSLSQSLWKYDIIEIVPPTAYTPTSSVTCASVTLTGVSNILYGPQGDNNLPCAIATSSSASAGPQSTTTVNVANSVYIYGLAQDVYLSSSSLSVKLSVTSFNYPGYKQPSSSNTWKVNIWRWGTTNMIAQYSASTGPTTPTEGTVTATWAPISGISANDVVSGMTIFTKVSFTTTHDIPAGGNAVIAFANVDIQTPKWWSDLDGTNSQAGQCYLTVPISEASCTVNSATQVTISFTNAQKAGSVSIALLVTFSASPKVSSITTSNGSYNIDYSTNLASWTLSSTNTAFSLFRFHGYQDCTAATNYPASAAYTANHIYGADTSLDLFWIFTHSVTWTTSTSIVINLQQSTTQVYNLPYIGSSPGKYEKDTTLGSATQLAALGTNTFTISGNQITVAFPSTAPSSTYYIMSLTGTTTALPYVASNLGTFYESYAKATTSTSIEIGSSVYSVLAKDYAGTDIYATPLCLNNKGSGIPIVVAFKAELMTIDFTSSTNTFVLEIAFTSGASLGTSLAAGSALPYYSSTSGLTVTLSQTTSPATLKITGLGSVTTSASAITLFLATGNYPVTAFSSVATVYYTTSSDSTLKNVLYKSTVTKTLTNTQTALSAGSSASTWSISSSGSLSITGAKSAADTTQGEYIGIGLPKGFTASSPTVTVASIAATSNIYVSSSSDSMSGGFVMGINSASTAFVLDDTTAEAITITGLSAPGFSGSSAASTNSVTFNFFVSSATPGSACTVNDITSITGTVSTGAISSSATTCSSSSTTASGPDSVDSTMTIGVTTVHNIPKGGTITLTLSSSWTYYGSSCTVSGLSDYDSNTKVSCLVGSNSVTITQFAAFTAGTITVTIPHVLTPSSASTVQCVTGVTTQDAASNYIDYGASLTQNVVISDAVTSGTSSGITATAFPNFAGAVGADIYLSFSLTKALPAGSLIDISAGFASWSRSSGSIKDYCWANIDYTSCSITSSKVELAITNSLPASTTVQIYLDAALTLPSTAGATTSGWQITTSWNSVTITTDSTGTPFTVGAAVSTAITITSIKISDITNAGEAGTYVFSFSSAAAIASGDYFVVQFPRGFDAYIGDATNTYSDCLPSTWYLGCSSTALGSVSCTADHWYLLVSGLSKTATASSSIDLTVQGVRNPTAGSTGYFNIYHYKSDGTVKAFITSTTSVTTTAVSPSSITLKDVMTDSTQLSASAKYTFDFYVPSGTYTNDNKIVITFPEQFNLQLYIGSSASASCSTSYYDESNGTGTDHTKALSWISVTSCAVSGQQITMALPSGTSQTFATTSKIQIALSSINNPQWGLDRPSTDKWWDNVYTSPYGDYSYWTSRFGLAITSTTNTAISYKSYGILNSAYLGFALSTTSTKVGSYNPANMSGKIQVAPGTQTSDITVKLDDAWPLASRSVKLTPSSNVNYADSGNLKYTSAHYSWMIYQMYPSLNFRVAALTGTAVGIYYIDWAITEVPQTGLSAIYSTPLSIMVEVCQISAATISIATIPTINIGTKSIPIAMTLSNAPASDLTVTPSFGTTTTAISINPTSLTFKQDVNVLYFQLIVSSSYTTASPSLSFTLTGTDAAAFTQPSAKSVTVSTSSSTATAATVNLSSSVKSVNQVVVTATCSQNIVLYWSLSCKGSVVPTFSELISMTADLISKGSGTYYLQEQLDSDYSATETAPDYTKGDTDIQSFFRRQHKEHCASPWTSSQVIYSGTSASIDLNWLMGGTDYTFTGYAVNEVTNNTTPVTISFSTSSLPSVSTYSVQFSGSVAQTSGDNIKLSLAKNMGINPAWLTLQSYNGPTSRFLADSTTTFTYNVLYDRSKSYTPANIIANIDQTQLSSDLTTLVGTSPTLTSGTAASATTPTWATAPAYSTVGETSAAFTATSTVAGTVHVSCTESVISGKNVYAWQVIDGLDGNSEIAYAATNNSTASTSTTLTVSGLTGGTTYYCYFTACNSYPLWPTCIDYSSTASLAMVTIKTTTPDDDSAMVLGAIAGLFLIFN